MPLLRRPRALEVVRGDEHLPLPCQSSLPPLLPDPRGDDVGDVGVVASSFLRAEPMVIIDDPRGGLDDITGCVDRVVLHLYKVSCSTWLVAVQG